MGPGSAVVGRRDRNGRSGPGRAGRHRAIGLGPWAEPIFKVAFSPEGRRLAAANTSGTNYVFRLAPPAPAPKASKQ
jgi:hypothetical protein